MSQIDERCPCGRLHRAQLEGICGKTSCPIPKPHLAHRCDHGIVGPCLGCEDWPWLRTENPAAAFEAGAARGERHRAWILSAVARIIRRAADHLDGGSK